jgi:hypothetical protein
MRASFIEGARAGSYILPPEAVILKNVKKYGLVKV